MSKVSLNTSLNEVIIRYLEFCEVDKNLSQNTIKMYAYYLHDFLQWLKKYLDREEIQIKDINVEVVKKYRVNLNRRANSKNDGGLKRSTQNTFLIALRAFLRFLSVEEELEVMTPEKIILGKSEDTLPKVLNEEQLERLFQVQNLNKRSGVRDRTILEVLFSTGLRVSELVSLDVDDINPESSEFSVMGKGRKIRTVYLSDGARSWLKRYLATRQDNFKPLFIRYSGKKMQEKDFEGESLRLSVRSVQRLVKKYITRAGISVDATPHTLRHSFATGLLKEGADIRSVQELLGHSNVSTTQIYTHVTNQQLKEAHKKYHKDIGDDPSTLPGDRVDTDSISSIA